MSPMQMDDDDAIKVHIVNVDDIKATPTVEVEPEHFTASSFTLPALGLTSGDAADANANVPVQILNLDPMRKEAVLAFSGTGQVILAHSQAQAMSMQASAAEQVADTGFLITAPSTIRVQGTGPLWAVSAASGTVSGGASVMAHNQTTSPAPAAILANIPAASLPAGTYTVYAHAYVDGTLVAAADDDNVELSYGSTIIGVLNMPADSVTEQSPMYGPVMITVNGAQAIKILAVGAGTTGSVYHTWLMATPYPFTAQAAGGAVTVGVLQERRGA